MAHGERKRRERGAIGITALFFMIALGGMLALGLNVGHMMKVRNQLQNRCDAAALAGAKQLDGTQSMLVQAHQVALDYALKHRTDDNDNLDIDLNAGNDPAGDIVHGVWDFHQADKALAFTPADNMTPAANINAVLVRSGRTVARGNPLQVFFGNFLGASTTSVGAEAIAVSGSPCEGCSIPIAFADCLVRQDDGTIDCGEVLQFASSNDDNIGFTNLLPDDSGVNPPTIREIMRGGCRSVRVGDNIGIQNGNDFVPVFDEFAALVNQQVTAPIISPASCPDPQFNRLQPVVGFATFTILAVNRTGSDKSITIRLDCDEDSNEPVQGGCGDPFGTRAPFTRLVR
jgi:Flp pilus assembly protein TadG